MKKKIYQRPAVRIIPILPGEPLNFSWETGDIFSPKKELDWEEEEEEDNTPNRFGYWD